jgi:hypothetical protein
MLPESKNDDRIALSDTGCYAKNEGDVIKVYNQQGSTLFALNPKVVQYEEGAITGYLQVYVIGVNNGVAAGREEIKKKVTELLKIAL